MIAVQFIHELMTPGPHFDKYWLKSFPKKLENQPQYISGKPTLVEWGIYITEGLNWALLTCWTLFMVLCTAIVVLLYSLVTKDTSSGLAVGQILIAILALGLGQSWAKWQNA